MQPIKFRPILKETVWGGNKIPNIKHLNGFEDRRTGESWEISGLEGNESIVDGGEYDGLPLPRLADILKEKLVGAENYRRFDNRFPLLVKFIDARQDLSVQVHPDDETARRLGMMNGKNEMWYLLESEPDATLRCGLKEVLTPDGIKRKVADGTICDSIAQYNVKAGDCFYIPRAASTASGQAVLLRKYSRHLTRRTAFTTTTVETKTVTCANCTLKKP